MCQLHKLLHLLLPVFPCGFCGAGFPVPASVQCQPLHLLLQRGFPHARQQPCQQLLHTFPYIQPSSADSLKQLHHGSFPGCPVCCPCQWLQPVQACFQVRQRAVAVSPFQLWSWLHFCHPCPSCHWHPAFQCSLQLLHQPDSFQHPSCTHPLHRSFGFYQPHNSGHCQWHMPGTFQAVTSLCPSRCSVYRSNICPHSPRL